jgi:hypothetical protein
METLQREVEVSAGLPRFGFEAACEPLVIHEVISGKQNSGCLVSKVTTDLRIDEVLCALWMNAGHRLSMPERRGLATELGRAEGSLYAALHRRNIVRGIGNSWFGNEALAEDGRLLLCDLENLFFSDCVSPRVGAFYARHEVNFFHMAVWRSLLMDSHSEHPPLSAALIGGDFLDAFHRAYDQVPQEPRTAPNAADYVKAVASDQTPPAVAASTHLGLMAAQGH